MAEVIVTTQSGSVYTLDPKAKTWKRLKGPDANVMRSDGGEFHKVESLGIGKRMVLICPPFDKEYADIPRAVISTEVVEINGLYHDYTLW